MHETSDHALVVHVWHLDVLEDLVDAAQHLPVTTDQFVTLPDSFLPEQRAKVTSAFPRATLVEVENRGQDIGALFQLMQKVDLGRYDFICKIHTKKGMGMAAEWRRGLLDGVLGSEKQVNHIIKGFREDSQVMLAGAKQLYFHGPSYIDPNGPHVVKSFINAVGDFKFRTESWGFIGGTCFWIRTDVLMRMAECQVRFEPAAYATDGTITHATERVFGMLVAILQGKVILQDLRFPEKTPDKYSKFPKDLPDRHIAISGLLTPLLVNNFLKVKQSSFLSSSSASNLTKGSRRVAIFSIRSLNDLIPDYIIYYLQGLKKVADSIIVVLEGKLKPGELEKISKFTPHVVYEGAGEHRTFSYRRGIDFAEKSGLTSRADSLVLCDDSCYGPVISFEKMFDDMDARGLDFWGATENRSHGGRLQNYFIVLGRKTFESAAFKSFIRNLKIAPNEIDLGGDDDAGLTKLLSAAGFKHASYIRNLLTGSAKNDLSYNDPMLFPIYNLDRGLPFVRVRSLLFPHVNIDGPSKVVRWLKATDSSLCDAILSHADISKFEDSEGVGISLIMPTYNRSHSIAKAVKSVLASRHDNFELIIVDDGSTDGTEQMIAQVFHEEIEARKIRYIRLKDNVGVCLARNIGVSYANMPWIGYVDSDNEIRPYMLTLYANSIVEQKSCSFFYSQIFMEKSGIRVGKPFDRTALLAQNYIDLGVVVHKKSLVYEFGGFDPDLRRLVDWDLIIRYTKNTKPFFIDAVCLDYDDRDTQTDRISVRESVVKALTAVKSKHIDKPVISTVIVSYNHQDFIVEAIESALMQKGDFHHEILLSDDGSSDSTRRIVRHYAQKHPTKIRNISREENYGISENYKHCFREAQGKYVAVLEGDDYWTDPDKLMKQAEFLRAHQGAAMVMSRIELLDMGTGRRRLLKRQEGLPQLLSAEHFAKNEHLNLIGNFSSCMFRRDVMRDLPDAVYQPRLNEITLAFYLDRIGSIGFLSQVMSTYRLNEKSVWTGSSSESKLRQAIEIRRSALRLARLTYRGVIQTHIDAKVKLLQAELAKSTKAA